jgi:hypothetical protein
LPSNGPQPNADHEREDDDSDDCHYGSYGHCAISLARARVCIWPPSGENLVLQPRL